VVAKVCVGASPTATKPLLASSLSCSGVSPAYCEISGRNAASPGLYDSLVTWFCSGYFFRKSAALICLASSCTGSYTFLIHGSAAGGSTSGAVWASAGSVAHAHSDSTPARANNCE
jgi:hypothetical protein